MQFQAKIENDPKNIFFYLRTPPMVQARLEEFSRQIAAHTKTEPQAVDHVTLLYMPGKKDYDPEVVSLVVQAAKDVVINVPELHARMQGWAYFDNEDDTALVALIDCPGIPDLYVRLKEAVESLGIRTKPKHGFIPHATVNYLPSGTRVDYLPRLQGEFSIRHCEISNQRTFPITFGHKRD